MGVLIDLAHQLLKFLLLASFLLLELLLGDGLDIDRRIIDFLSHRLVVLLG